MVRVRTVTLSAEALAAAQEWEQILADLSYYQQQMGSAEQAFQVGGDPGPERLARSWVEAAFEVGYRTRKLDEAMEHFTSAMKRLGISQSLAESWHPRHVLQLRVGADLPGKPGPVPDRRT